MADEVEEGGRVDPFAVEFSPEVDWALRILERARPEAARILRLRLLGLPKPDRKIVDDLELAAGVLRFYAHTGMRTTERHSHIELADRLELYARELLAGG